MDQDRSSKTPLHAAACSGNLGQVRRLVEVDDHFDKQDHSSQTAQEHAALRGHLDVARYLDSLKPAQDTGSGTESKTGTQAGADSGDATPNGSLRTFRADARSATVPSTRQPLTDGTLVLVSLGAVNNRKALQAVELDAPTEAALSLVISAPGNASDSAVIDLPLEDPSISPVAVFKTTDLSKAKVVFDLKPTNASDSDKTIARAVALLSSIKFDVGPNRMNLQTDLSVPLLAGETMEVIGVVNFNFLTVSPFHHANASRPQRREIWSQPGTKIVGHRGLGKNMAPDADGKRNLQLGENTIDSFATAARLGASYVEFDVQMTKDLVPVIYHDFMVDETGADVPVHTLTSDQFLGLNGEWPIRKTQRSLSLDSSQEHIYPNVRDRMKYTKTFQQKGFKGNLRGEFISSPFTTLSEMFKTLPTTIGFNIEMKYPMLWETIDDDMDTYAIEMNTYVDGVLKTVFDLAGEEREIVFSSFHPDVCIMLSTKQSTYPILFLTDAGGSPVDDVRASSLLEAMRFAKRWGLLGIVSAAQPFVLCPRLIRVVKEAGLVCVSYGTDNNEVVNARLQAEQGIDALIVDKVAKVRKGLDEWKSHGT